MRDLNLRDREAEEDAQQHQLNDKRTDQHLGIQFNAEKVDCGDKADRGARDDVDQIGRQAFGHLRCVRGERQGGNNG